MFILLAVLAAAAVAALELFAFCPDKTPGRCVSVGFKNLVAVPVLTIAFYRYVLQYPHFLKTEGCHVGDFVGFFFAALAVGLLLLLVHAVITRQLVFKHDEIKHSKGAAALRIFSVVMVFLGCLCFFMTDWSKQEYGDLPSNQIFITYASPTVGSSMVDYTDVLEGPVFRSLLIAVLAGLFVFSKFRLVWSHRGRNVILLRDLSRRIVSISLSAVLLVSGLSYCLSRFNARALFSAFFVKSDFIEDTYVSPQDVNMQFPEKKRNLIHIFLESVENSYMSREEGGFMEENLIPELTELAKGGYSFSHLDHQFGGPQSATGTTWSVASMVNMTTGLPMNVPMNPKAFSTPDRFLPGAIALGDLLEAQGYEQTLMFGADSDFGGLTYYFTDHGHYKIMDHKYAKENGLVPPDYNVWWGFEDDKLFEFAKDEITRMSQTGKPFNFIMETADTHRPDGYLSEHAQQPYGSPYANVLRYSSQQVAAFVEWIKAQPFYENTTVVIIGDHLSMETNFFEYYDFTDDFQRSQYNVILNPAPGTASREHEILFNRIYGNFDMFPTIMTALGVTYDGHRLGIGTDLFSGAPTVFEEFGFKKINRELEKKSSFYNSNFFED